MEYRIEVDDAVARRRQVVVSDAPGKIHIAPPPGAGFILTADEADLLDLAIIAAYRRAVAE
ncbi:hypothetical protein [Actinophytocola sp. NPDC049390]|uniref:hypothetical protein n=1 Tax=Actinophytocola sp. NPDC049390 TaxID=3363894 RepID=UPI00379CD0A0